MGPMRYLFLLCCLAFIIGPGPARAEVGAREYKAAVKGMAGAIREFDTAAFLRAFATVLKRNDAKAIKAAADAYGRLITHGGDELTARRFYFLHGRTAKAFSGITGPKALREMRRLQTEHNRWQARLLLLDAASFNNSLDLLEAALLALEDDEAVVIRRALTYLGKVKKRSIVEAIIQRYLAVSGKTRQVAEKSEWNRADLAFQSALTKMLKVELTSAEDYRNYLSGRKDDEDLFNPPHAKAGQKTVLTLFGASVTGKNIVFVIDTSGSMLTTDRLPDRAKKTAKTVVVGRERGELRRAPLRDRQRIVRAKKELAKVVKALPEDVNFNIIAFSSAVDPWLDELVRARSGNKKKALKFIDSLEADGITITDLALEEAFADLGVDTIYLITDGAPTHVGSRGGFPEDAEELIKSIHRRTKAINFLRGVRIFTLGFRGAEEEFLKKLSRDHAGKYVRVE